MARLSRVDAGGRGFIEAYEKGINIVALEHAMFRCAQPKEFLALRTRRQSKDAAVTNGRCSASRSTAPPAGFGSPFFKSPANSNPAEGRKTASPCCGARGRRSPP